MGALKAGARAALMADLTVETKAYQWVAQWAHHWADQKDSLWAVLRASPKAERWV